MINPRDFDTADFLGRWYGPPSSCDRWTVPEEVWIPEPLKEWYGFAASWSQIRSAGLVVYAPTLVQGSNGKFSFMKDPTGDWIWAFDVNEPDRVYEGEASGNLSRMAEGLDEFLVHSTLVQTVYASEFARHCDQLPLELLDGVLAPLDRVSFGGWSWPRPEYFVFLGDSLIANVGPAVDVTAPWRNREGFAAVRIAGIARSDLAYLDSFSSIKWINSDLGD